MKKVFLFLIFLALVKVPVIIFTQLTGDEAYYYEWSRFIDLSYFDHPPMVAYLIKISTLFFGDNEFGVRFPALFFSFLTGLFIFLFVKKMSNQEKAWNSLFFSSVVLLFAVGSVITTPDTPLVFFVLLTFYFLIQTDKRSKKDNLFYLLSGISYGFALLSKYQAILFIPGILVLFKQKKSSFKKILIFFIPSFLVFSPVIIWNFQNDFISFRFQFSHGFGKKGINIGNIFLYIGESILILGFPLSILMFINAIKGLLKEKLSFLTLNFFVPYFFFLLTSLKFKAEANWASAGYLFLVVLASLWTKRDKIFWLFFVISASCLFYIHIHALYPFFNFKRDPVIERMKGWREIAKIINRIKIDENKPVYANTYQLASLLSFYLPGKPFVPSLNIKSRENQYSIWSKKWQKEYPREKVFIFIGEINPEFEKKFKEIVKLFTISKNRKKVDIYRIKK